MKKYTYCFMLFLPAKLRAVGLFKITSSAKLGPDKMNKFFIFKFSFAKSETNSPFSPKPFEQIIKLLT